MELDYTVETAKSVDEAAAQVERLTAEKNFKVLAVHDMSETLKSKGFDQAPMKIVEICGARYAYNVLQADPKISLMLPCPISVYEQNGKVLISALLPTLIAQFYPYAGVYAAASEVEGVVREIVDGAK